MEKLWAPWRMAYIETNSESEGCFLCDAVNGADDEQGLVVWRGRQSVCVLNKYPYNNGHLLVAPSAHKGELDELDDEELLESQHAVRRMIDGLRRAIRPHGFNVGLNLGQIAGAGLPGHLHWHIVPRWSGDTNFMPVLGDTKVVSQSLAALYDRLKAALAE